MGKWGTWEDKWLSPGFAWRKTGEEDGGSTEWNPRDGPELSEEAHVAGKWWGQDWKYVDQILRPCWNPGVRKWNLALSLFLYILEHSHPHHIWLMAAFVLQTQWAPATQGVIEPNMFTICPLTEKVCRLCSNHVGWNRKQTSPFLLLSSVWTCLRIVSVKFSLNHQKAKTSPAAKFMKCPPDLEESPRFPREMFRKIPNVRKSSLLEGGRSVHCKSELFQAWPVCSLACVGWKRRAGERAFQLKHLFNLWD